jgi:hypothetical protein
MWVLAVARLMEVSWCWESRFSLITEGGRQLPKAKAGFDLSTGTKLCSTTLIIATYEMASFISRTLVLNPRTPAQSHTLVCEKAIAHLTPRERRVGVGRHVYIHIQLPCLNRTPSGSWKGCVGGHVCTYTVDSPECEQPPDYRTPSLEDLLCFRKVGLYYSASAAAKTRIFEDLFWFEEPALRTVDYMCKRRKTQTTSLIALTMLL